MSLPGSIEGERVSEAGERALIERIRQRVPAADPNLLVGIGDDAAVAAPDRGALQVLTTDALVEGVHFDRRFSSPSGYRLQGARRQRQRHRVDGRPLQVCAAVVDAAGRDERRRGGRAAGRAPRSGGPDPSDPGWRQHHAISRTAHRGRHRHRKCQAAKGADPQRRPRRRRLYVTGQIGAAAAGLDWLRQEAEWPIASRFDWTPKPTPSDEALADCVARHCRPEPRARIGSIMGRTKTASACMDLSDGLADAVAQISSASGTGARIHADLPSAPRRRAGVVHSSRRRSDVGHRLPGATTTSCCSPSQPGGGDGFAASFERLGVSRSPASASSPKTARSDCSATAVSNPCLPDSSTSRRS